MSLAERKRTATRQRVAAAAAQAVVSRGLAGVTVKHIADEAGIGRATFFRYFNSKEDAVAEGMNAHWLNRIAAALATQPAGLTAIGAVVGAFHELARIRRDRGSVACISNAHEVVRDIGCVDATHLRAVRTAIAELVAPWIPQLAPQDPRPRLIGALAWRRYASRWTTGLATADHYPTGCVRGWPRSPISTDAIADLGPMPLPQPGGHH